MAVVQGITLVIITVFRRDRHAPSMFSAILDPAGVSLGIVPVFAIEARQSTRPSATAAFDSGLRGVGAIGHVSAFIIRIRCTDRLCSVDLIARMIRDFRSCPSFSTPASSRHPAQLRTHGRGPVLGGS